VLMGWGVCRSVAADMYVVKQAVAPVIVALRALRGATASHA
jgi:hypothetical protein